MKNNLILDNEVLDDLQLNGIKIIQNRQGYCFTSDSVLLANFVNARKTDYCLEIGSGSAVISILVNEKCNPKKILCFEIQKRLADMSSRSIILNNLQDKISIINDDIKNYDKYVNEKIDVVYSNPPYRKFGGAILSENEELVTCKYENTLNMSQLCEITSKILKDKGKFYIVYDANRLAELIFCLKKNNLEPKKMFLTQPSIDKKPILCLIECIKGGKEGISVLPTLITNDNDGTYIQTIQKLYK